MIGYGAAYVAPIVNICVRIRTAGQQRPATIVGTASYQHTLHRVRTMTEKALALRIRAIERGASPSPPPHDSPRPVVLTHSSGLLAASQGPVRRRQDAPLRSRPLPRRHGGEVLH
jgi:hypothetical protein